MGKSKGFPFDNYFKMPNILLGDKEHPGWVRKIGAKGLMVYCLIAKQYNPKEDSGVYASHRSMAKLLGISKTTLEEKLKLLLGIGLIERVPCGKRHREMWTYKPRVPVPESCQENGPPTGLITRNKGSEIGPKKGLNEPENDPKREMNGPENGPIIRKFGPVSEKFGPIPVLKCSPEPKDGNDNTAIFRSRTRLYTRLKNKNMSPEEQVTSILQNLDQIDLKTQVQVAWNYWCHIWEEHYGRPYYPAKTKSNSKVIPKDKKNLRDKIKAVGFGEVVARMDRCIEICDKIFPCRQNGEWLQPITLNDFVNNHFFDKWIPQKSEIEVRGPKSKEDKLKAAMDKRRMHSGSGLEKSEA